MSTLNLIDNASALAARGSNQGGEILSSAGEKLLGDNQICRTGRGS